MKNEFATIKYKIKKVNKKSSDLTDASSPFFEEIYLKVDGWENHQLTFYQLVSWFYVLYFECAGIDLKFIKNLLPSVGVNLDQKLRNHDTLTIHHLRSMFQHNLNPSSKSNKSKVLYCQEWFKNACGENYPKDEDCWKKCVIAIIFEAKEFLKALIFGLESIEKDEFCELIISDWIRRRKASLKPFEYEKYVKKASINLGVKYINTVKICKKQAERWNGLIFENYSEADVEIETAVYSVVENYLIKQIEEGSLIILPITAKDLIDNGIPPGKKIGELLSKASRIAKENLFDINKEELLAQLLERKPKT